MNTPRQTTAAPQAAVNNTQQTDSWIHRPNVGTGFEGKPALQKMLMPGTAGLKHVRQYLYGWLA